MDILQEAAKNFHNATGHHYELTVGNKKRKITFIIPSVDISEFTHIFGLDHLKDIAAIRTKNITQKSAVFKKILSNQISFSDISSSKYIKSKILFSYNYLTESEYTVEERIYALSNFESILDNLYSGRVFKWDPKKNNVKIPNGKQRKISIGADFLLVIPTANKNEKLYLFAYQKNKKRDKSEAIELNIFSAFPDGVDIANGQANSYTILQEKKNGNAIFTHQAYQKQLKQQEENQTTSELQSVF